MEVFDLRDRLIRDYEEFIRGYIPIKDQRIEEKLNEEFNAGRLWPDPLIQMSPSFEPGGTIEELVSQSLLHPECRRIFRKGKPADTVGVTGAELRLHRHQTDAIKLAATGASYILTTGTGSGKSLAYIIPIVDHVLRAGSGQGTRAIIVYPMNALANSQLIELEKFLCHGYPDGQGPVTFARYTGQEKDERRQEIIANPPDILLTNYVMLELLLTRPNERNLIDGCTHLRFLVLDEIHTYRGRQGADVSMLVRRTREAFSAKTLQCVGTSATLASGGGYDQQRAEIARVATTIFGAEFSPHDVIVETLRRATPDTDLASPVFIDQLRQCLQAGGEPPASYELLVAHPLSIWVESTFGVATDGVRTERPMHGQTGRLVRRCPIPITGKEGAAQKLATLTALPVKDCQRALERHLLAGYQVPDPRTGFPTFAFRVHQFISRGDTVYASVEHESERHLSFSGQLSVPGQPDKALLPLVFCRECGQEYYCVDARRDPELETDAFFPRRLSQRAKRDDPLVESGFLFLSHGEPWPEDGEGALGRLPEDWLEEHKGTLRVRADRKDDVPRLVHVAPDGRQDSSGITCHFIPAPFRFCLSCGVSRSRRATSDFAKLTSLGTEGRATAITVLSLAAIRQLRADRTLHDIARKLLSFTDNRQDASLQAGHFNDFVEIGLLRSAVYKAIKAAGSAGIEHEELTQKVFDALALPLESYALEPGIKYDARKQTDRAMRDVLGYRLYRDLERGWRVTAPNLEQCALLRIEYSSLDELCRDQDEWAGHPVLAGLSPEQRHGISRTLLDYLRRELAIKVEYLDSDTLEKIRLQSAQRLRLPWAIDENEVLRYGTILYPRSSGGKDWRGNTYLSSRSGFGIYLRRELKAQGKKLSLQDTAGLILFLLEALRHAGLVAQVAEKDDQGVAGYQVPASAMRWLVGDGHTLRHDPIAMPNPPAHGLRVNPFFKRYYQEIAADGLGIEAHEHTAQVPDFIREQREEQFRAGTLPVLYCSPTMELGIDISELSAVNMRNVPPTPANYAQRSGRAGRSGQPALIFTYCSTASSHDQYFFRHPADMVAGAVRPPRIDLTNEDLIRAHVQAIWLAQTKAPLGNTPAQVLDVQGDTPTLTLLPQLKGDLENPITRRAAAERINAVLDTIRPLLASAGWYHQAWVDEVLSQTAPLFDRSMDRWRNLYNAALKQNELQNKIIRDASRSAKDKESARRLWNEAKAQIGLLTEARNVLQSDFYIYRYLASEGFLPGYSFPRLPLSAYIPGRRARTGRDEYLSRPRFLAISEFGPRTLLYHEGSRYRIERVLLTVESQSESGELVTTAIKQCGQCGHVHPVVHGPGPDVCRHCRAPLDQQLSDLLRLQNVSTRRQDRISSDEEERQRQGYEIRTGLQFGDHPAATRVAQVTCDDQPVALLTYGQAATIWQLNLGWRKTALKGQYGFTINSDGYWSRNEADPEDDHDSPSSSRRQRVIPYVEDHKNCLLVQIVAEMASLGHPKLMASLQAALKNAIQIVFQLEDSELAAEPLPSDVVRRRLLFFESAEGGAGVLRQLLDEPGAMAEVARCALALCHFDPDTGADQRHAPTAQEDCAKACYDCLMSYGNQSDHLLLDRHAVLGVLLQLSRATVSASPSSRTREEHLAGLLRQCQSKLEQRWLRWIDDHKLRLPSHAQVFIEECTTRPDFLYREQHAAIYVDGPPHEEPTRHHRDTAQTAALEDLGYTVLRFASEADWQAIVGEHPSLFGGRP